MSIMYFNSLWIIQRVACILYKTARAAAATLKFSKRDAACWSRKGGFMRGSRRQIHRAGRQSIRPVACNTRHSTLHACCNFGFCFCYGFLFLLRSLGLTHTHTHTHTRYYRQFWSKQTTWQRVSLSQFVVLWSSLCFSLYLVVSGNKM